MKIAKIIATSFFPRTVRKETILAGNPPAYSLHSQNFKNIDEIKKLILFNIEKENECNAGLQVDLVFVNNDVGNIEGNKFIDSLVNKNLRNGNIKVIQNNNIGWSYGAFNKGFQKFKDFYDYFIFTEDDVIVAKENYASISLETFEKNKNCGFVSYWGISYIHEKLSKDEYIHAHGASGFSSKKVLEKVLSKHGSLPHSNFSEKKDYQKIILDGEIKFTNVIHNMGYELIESPIKLFHPAYDLMRGIEKPWKPTKIEETLWKSKKKVKTKIYNMLKNLKLHKIYKKIKNTIYN